MSKIYNQNSGYVFLIMQIVKKVEAELQGSYSMALVQERVLKTASRTFQFLTPYTNVTTQRESILYNLRSYCISYVNLLKNKLLYYVRYR